MSLFTKSVSFLAVMAVIPASYALTARPSVIGKAVSRAPQATAVMVSGGVVNAITTTQTSSQLKGTDCVNEYTSCMKGDGACGSDFEECTTKVLFHGKMPQCLSTLAQCDATGISSLFGSGATITNLSTTPAGGVNDAGEITAFTYPTDGSLLGQIIIGSAIANKYDTTTCVKRYTSCLNKDNVCGQDFELCTDKTEFKKQSILCDSTLARCQSTAKKEMFGVEDAGNVEDGSRIDTLIKEGAALAAMNAVNTCYKVADQCILNACADNPFKCYEQSTQYLVNLAEKINNPDVTTADIKTLTDSLESFGKRKVSEYIKHSCFDTIGTNKYCYITTTGKTPTNSKLKDEENQEAVYDFVIDKRMNAGMNTKISDLVTEFDAKAKNKCAATIKSCIMRTCGSGSGAACYSEVFGGNDKTINNSEMYEELKTGCSAVTNTDAYCKYAALNPNSSGTYSYKYSKNDAFTTLFPVSEGKGVTSDPIGVVAGLNATLQSSYNDTAIAQMRKRCQTVASSCVRSMCGTDYQDCYRNRTDVYSDLTKTENKAYDNSMNKVGGVLDYNVVLGLCLDTVKNASACEEHLKIQEHLVEARNRVKNTDTGNWLDANGSKYGSVREGWIDAGSATKVSYNEVWAEDDNGNHLCTAANGTAQGRCDYMECGGQLCEEPVMISSTAYKQTQAANSLFKDLVYDLEKEAQAKYNAKLTREQNQCLAANNGGIKGKNDLGSTFQWVKLRSSKVPKTYTMAGLKDNEFVASNDIYGSFCRVRVTLQSDEKKIQDIIAGNSEIQGVNNKWGTAYFAAGNSFTCGSWIPESALNAMAKAVAGDARKQADKGNERVRNWMAVVGSVGGAAGGAAWGNAIANGKSLGGLTTLKNKDTQSEAFEQCTKLANQAARSTSLEDAMRYSQSAINKVDNGLKNLSKKQKNQFNEDGLTKARDALSTSMLNGGYDYTLPKTDTISSVESQKDAAVKAAIEKGKQDISNSCAIIKSGGATSGCSTAGTCKYDTSAVGYNYICGSFTLSESILDSAISHVQTQKDEEAKSGCGSKCVTNQYLVSTLTGIKSSVDGAKNGTYTAVTTTTMVDNTAAANAKKLVTVQNAAAALATECSNVTNKVDFGTSDKTKAWITAGTTVATSIAGGVLAYQATKSIQNAKLDKVEQEAFDQFMNDVGNHITCMIGSEPAGNYGDIVETSLVE